MLLQEPKSVAHNLSGAWVVAARHLLGDKLFEIGAQCDFHTAILRLWRWNAKHDQGSTGVGGSYQTSTS